MSVKFITLTEINRAPSAPASPALLAHIGEIHDGEDDGFESAGSSGEAPASEPATKPNTIQVDQIRNFYPRKNNQPGSRVVLKSGVAYIVTETHDQILALINAV